MFDNVGRTVDAGAGRRRAVSLLLGSTGLGGGIVFALVWGAMTVIEPRPVAPAPDEPIAQVDLVEQDFRPEAPPVRSAAPPPPIQGRAEPEIRPPEPDEPVDPAPLQEVRDRPVVDQRQSAGTADGDPNGVVGGQAGGVVGGDPGGTGDGVGSGALRLVRSDALEVRRRVLPDYPAEAEAMGLGEQLCAVRMDIDEKGRPGAIQITGCPEVFHVEAREAMAKWRWYPPRVDRQRGAVQTRILVRFVSR